jgi:biopolymer transport protein ExbD
VTDAPDPGLTIVVRDQDVSVEGERIPIELLEARLREGASPCRATIAADARVAASVVSRVTEAAHAAGCDDVSLVVLPPR